MRLLLQRTTTAWVTFPGHHNQPQGPGLAVLVGFCQGDVESLLEPMADKMITLRIFPDEEGRMNRSLADTGGTLVLVPQFTLYADARKGRRPNFMRALEPEKASGLFQRFADICRGRVPHTQTGQFGADMDVHLVNQGPVTILLDSQEMGW
ncbi:MAG: D-aminoacyl-tRNA deacylase [Deltaproteobacteria bacterium]|nr:D-aminoacyl-tRNA deacylase [Deltaproteobacteria bacterium]